MAPQKYQGGREVADFMEFLKKEASTPFEIPEKKSDMKKSKESTKEEL